MFLEDLLCLRVLVHLVCPETVQRGGNEKRIRDSGGSELDATSCPDPVMSPTPFYLDNDLKKGLTGSPLGPRSPSGPGDPLEPWENKHHNIPDKDTKIKVHVLIFITTSRHLWF